MKKKKPELVLLVFIIALFVGMAVVSILWRNNSLYTGAYKEKTDRASEYNRSAPEEDDSVEPRARGLREREIDKQEGRRYKTF